MTDRISTEILPNGAIRYAEYAANGAFVQYRYLLPADDPIDEGTKINKANLFDDTTAVRFGLSGSSAVPNQGFQRVVVKSGDDMTGRLHISKASGEISATESAGQLELINAGTGAAGLTFHRSGQYAVNLGLANDAKLKIGGWSMGAVEHELHHDGNRYDKTVGMLNWKNYAGHVVFDASQGTAPNGTVINNTNTANGWAAGYPTLMGWNGTNTHGVRVDSARVADTLTGGATKYQTGSYVGNSTVNDNANPPWRTLNFSIAPQLVIITTTSPNSDGMG